MRQSRLELWSGMQRWYDEAMRRCLSKAFILLVLGAIINVAVAWGCLYVWGRVQVSSRLPTEHERQDWARNRPADFTQELSLVQSQSRLGLTTLSLTAYGEASSGGWIRIVPPTQGSWFEDNNRITAGWPCRALEGQEWHRRKYAAAGAYVVTRVSMLPFAQFGQEKWLPTRLLWPGFAINTIFYAAIVWGLFAMPFAIRRRWRIKRGVCVRCAYPVGTSSACSECGAPVHGAAAPCNPC
jgi:hypothetical protein